MVTPDNGGERRRRYWPAAMVLIGLFGLAACSEVEPAAQGTSTTLGADGSQPAGTATGALGTPGSPQWVAAQLGDLPPRFHLCDFSGDIETYIENHKGGRAGTYQSLVSTWNKLKSMGATEGYYAVYGDGNDACDFVIGRPTTEDPMGPGAHDDNARDHPSTVFSFVAMYRDEPAAAATYETGMFGQDSLGPPAYQVVRGDPTGLGPNSVVASNNASAPVTNAVWQSKSFTVLFGAENLKGSEPQTAIDNIYKRINA